MSKKDKRLYNYIVNTLGLSKEMALSYAKDRIEEVIEKILKNKIDSNHIENLILNRITQMVEGGVYSDGFPFYKREAFDDYIKQVIRQILEKRLNDEYTLEVKIVRKDRNVIAKV